MMMSLLFVFSFVVILVATALLTAFVYVLWDYVYSVDKKELDTKENSVSDCQKKEPASAAKSPTQHVTFRRDGAAGDGESDEVSKTPRSIRSGDYGLNRGSRSSGRKTVGIFEEQASQPQCSLFQTFSSDEFENSSKSRRTPLKSDRGNIGSKFPTPGTDELLHESTLTSPPIEFNEISIFDSALLPASASPSRFTEVFVVPSSCDISSPMMETSTSDSSEQIDGTRLERERQDKLMKRLSDKQRAFESGRQQNSQQQRQNSAKDSDAFQRSKTKAPPPPVEKAPVAAPVAQAAKPEAGDRAPQRALLGDFGPADVAEKPAPTPAPATKRNDAAQHLPPVKSDSSTSIGKLTAVTNASDYVRHLKSAAVDSRQPAIVSLGQVGLSHDMFALAENCLQRIRGMSSLSAADCSVQEAVESGSDLEVVVQGARKVSADAASHIRTLFANAILEAADTKGTEDDTVLMLSHLLLCLCKDSKLSAESISHAVLRKSALCWPALCPISDTHGGAVVNLEMHIRFVTIFSTLVASADFAPIFRKAEGWSWLVRMGKNLHRAVKLMSIETGEVNAAIVAGLRLGFSGTLKFLRICGRTLYLEYGPANMEDVLKGVLKVCANFTEANSKRRLQMDEVSRLSTHVNEILAGGKSKFLSLKSQPPFVMAAKAYASSLKKLKETAEGIDKDRSPQMKATKDSIGIKSLPLAFNIISSSQTSQDKAIDRLITTINGANSLNDRELLQYAVYKVTHGALGYCQTDHFDLKGAALPLVRVICNLCVAGGSLISAIFKMQFVSLCPFTIPKIVEEASGDSFFINMGFITKVGVDNKLIVESSEKWLARMCKLLGIYGFLCIQPEQNPLKFSDAWSWLSRLVNACSSMNGSPIEPTAKLLDTFLRVTSKDMLNHYGREYMSLLRRVQDRVLPVLSAENQLFSTSAHKKQLEDFLDDLLSSDGQNIQPVL